MTDTSIIKDVLAGMSVEEIKSLSDKNMGSNLIEPTESMIEEVILKYAQGISVREIKKSVKNADGKKLSFEQVSQIICARNEYLAEIEPIEEV